MGATLGLDTATDDTAVAVRAAGDQALVGSVVAERRLGLGEDGRPRHAETLLAAIEEVVAEAGGWPEIKRIAVGTGPGSFTGLRIGLATARALAASAGCELVGVPTLAALARAASDPRQRDAGAERVIAIGDARRGEVFAYAELDGPTAGPLVCAPDELLDRLGGAGLAGALAVGPGAVRFHDRFLAAGLEVPEPSDRAHRIQAAEIAALGSVAPVDAGPPRPIYLRAPDAERWRERDGQHKK
ncbi:MAG TPA: tRNA (adenosine(37)-N6)-threonylcarbamoyltransferase complex dimerization subunit type 1 TsaB [Solirubrobacterales bacterium]|nr:tRNA (adenosine(37)-N6)-threonylcarbamoyltransferase complex dimerization subunit type 1 TsaB [Solirubrobacterales bacterium]